MSLIRTLWLSSALAVTFAGCGPSSKPITNSGSSERTNTTAPALGTSGVAGLDWGADATAVLAVYPRATPTDGGLWFNGMAEGRLAITKYTIGAGGLDGVHVEWTDGFVSMEECATGWKTIRTKLDERFGASTSDNLAAYWKTASASITLACNPNDSNAGVLSLTYAHLDTK
ncbi:MAG: hypothetical protein H0T46_24900 [Deltaproteobacteria bacterium]|nr:hypothetical protein [Deltaproteobacteria bacterium]